MPNHDLARLTPSKVIDARWAPCPGPLLAAKESIGLLASGDILEIQTIDPGAHGDIRAWAGKVGHEFLGLLHRDGYDRIFIVVQRPVEPPQAW